MLFVCFNLKVSYGRGGRGLNLEVKLQKQVHDRVGIFYSCGASTMRSPHDELILLPSTSFGFQFQISPQIRTSLQYKLFGSSNISSDLLWVSENQERSCRLQCNLSGRVGASASLRLDTAVGWAWMNPFKVANPQSFSTKHSSNNGEWDANLNEENDEFVSQTQNKKGRISFILDCNSYDMVEARLGLNCILSNITRLSGEIGVSWLQGLTLRLSLHRGGQTYALPIKLSENLDPIALGYGTIVPLAIYGIVRNLVYAPWVSAQMKRMQSLRRQNLRDELRQRRSEALATQALMQHSAARNTAAEEASNGLVIVRGIYGSLSYSTPGMPQLPDLGGPVCIDVTTPLQASVEDHQLRLPPGRWADHQGFYDPCAGLVQTSPSLRRLFIAYRFNGLSHEVCVDENVGLAIPMSKHKVASFSQ